MADDQDLEARARRTQLAIEILRIGVGVVWALNFIYVLAPANNFFGNFGATAQSFAPTSLGGPTLAQFVAAHANVFSWLVAVLTGYLALGFIAGLTTRWACLLGGIFSAVLLGTQFGSIFVFPGGTDVGEHPLYLLIYVALVFGGAGRTLSLDHGIAEAWARRRATARAARELAPRRAWAAGVDSRFFAAYFIAGVLISFGVGAGLILAIPSTSSPSPTGPTVVAYENLTVTLNSSNGWPQYSPANFTVPTGRVIFTITDNDSPMAWSGCPCVVDGTPGGIEEVNGTPMHVVPSSNVAHSFNVPQLGLSIYSPGQSVVRFTADLLTPGSFTWFCIAPCGAGGNPFQSPPMGTPGFMTGTMTVG